MMLPGCLKKSLLCMGIVRDHRKKFYFGPKIMVPLRAPQAEAKRANANK